MAHKYPHPSGYNYCANNPVKYIDPNGKEKLNWIQKTGKDASLSRSADKVKDDEAIHIFSHGTPKGISVSIPGEKGEKYFTINNSKDLAEYLEKYSETWQNREDGESLTIVLHACRTGQGENSFAEMLSESKEFKNVNIIAPTEKDWFGDDGEVGTYKSIPQTDEKGNAKKNGGGRSDVKGNWVTFKNGEKTDTHKGDWKPKKVEE